MKYRIEDDPMFKGANDPVEDVESCCDDENEPEGVCEAGEVDDDDSPIIGE